MLDSLYTEALKKKGSINEDIDDLIDKKLDIDSNWNSEKINPSNDELTLAAGDGSFNKKKFRRFNFYAVGAESIIYNPKESGLKTVESVEVDILPHQAFANDRIRNMMSIFEIKTAIKALNEHDIDYYMDDGSVFGDLIRPIPVENKLSIEQKTQIIKKFHEKLKDEVESSKEISSFKFKNEFKDLFEDTNDENSLISFLESLEHLIALKKFLQKREKIIAVSKTSTSNEIFHTNIPDIAIFEMATNGEGFSKPYYRKVTSQVKHDFPISDEFFRSLWFTIVFARLEDNKNVIKIELPYHAGENEIRNILSIIKANSTDGYPFLLKKAHEDVVIKNNDMTRLSNILEIMDRTGREMLG